MTSLSYFWRTLPKKTKYVLLVSLLFIAYFLCALVFGKRRSSYTITTNISQGQSYTLAVRDHTPEGFLNNISTVILLHSNAFDSSIWEDIKTLDILCKSGYRAIAVDLPGYGNSRRFSPPKEDYEKAVLLETVLKELKATEAILVVPSMSGSYALPLVVRGSLKLKGFVPISPYNAEKFSEVEYSSLDIPTMIIYGRRDVEYGEPSANHLQNIPDSKIHIMKDSSHACYVQSPDEFHEVLLTFLNEIESGTFDLIRKEQAKKLLE